MSQALEARPRDSNAPSVDTSRQPDTGRSDESRFPVLDGLRAASILLVLAGHMLPLGPSFLKFNGNAAAAGMSLFFSLSGFLIATSLLHKDDVFDFAAKRFGRIFPLVFAYAFILLAFVKFDPLGFALAITFLLNYFPQHMFAYNEHLWSLCVEAQFYTAIGVCVLLGGKKAVWLVWPACVLITLNRVSEGAYTHIQTLLRVDEILSGACVATLYHHFRPRQRIGTAIWALTAACWLASASPHGGWLNFTRPHTTAMFLMATLCLYTPVFTALLSSRVLRYVATISYALYIFHPLSMYGWLHDGSPTTKYLIKRPISFALTFLAAHASTFYFERPILDAIKRRLRSRRGPGARAVGH